jgi:hypothetical protein
MIHAEISRSRPWAGIAWVAALMIGGLIALINIYAGMLLIAFSTALLVGYAALQWSRTLPASVASYSAPPRAAWQPMEQRTIATAEGVEQTALVIPIEQAAGYEMVLTVDGYKLVDGTGRVVYALKR